MKSLTQFEGYTFPLDNVMPGTEPLPTCRSYEAVRLLVGSPIESCSDYHGTVVANLGYQGLLAAVYTAYNLHRHLVLTPDAVWITISQGVAHHMALHAEELRSRFVAHQGKLNLQFRCRGWVEGTPENPWTEAFESWTQQIRNHVGDMIYDSMICSFSTTGVAERAASQIVMMDVFQRYFRFEVYCVCGIPGVTIEGTTADWQSIADRVATLDRFGLDWWLPHLRPICDHFVRASRGDIDFDHWWNICKLKSEYGGDIINGWIAKMFPYLAVGHHGPCTRRTRFLRPVRDSRLGARRRDFRECRSPGTMRSQSGVVRWRRLGAWWAYRRTKRPLRYGPRSAGP